MRHSEFWSVMDDVFGPDYARSLAADLVLGSLGGRTCEQALAAGVPPREVWESLCEATGQSDQARWLFRADEKERRRWAAAHGR